MIDILENHILNLCSVNDIWHFSITCNEYKQLFNSEHLWRLKFNNDKMITNITGVTISILGEKSNNKLTWFDRYVGIKVPLIREGDFVMYIRVNVDNNTIFPTIPYTVILLNYKGNPQRYVSKNTNNIEILELCSFTSNNIVDKAVIVKTMSYDIKDVRAINKEVENILMSSQGTPPIYGYHVEYFRKPIQFNILENVSIIPKVKALSEIGCEKGNLYDKIRDTIGLTRMNSLESILRHFITEDEISLLNEAEKRNRIYIELEKRHHLLPSRLGF